MKGERDQAGVDLPALPSLLLDLRQITDRLTRLESEQSRSRTDVIRRLDRVESSVTAAAERWGAMLDLVCAWGDHTKVLAEAARQEGHSVRRVVEAQAAQLDRLHAEIGKLRGRV